MFASSKRNIRTLLENPHSMDYKTAHQILNVTMLQAHPFMYAFATQWALIKSYGIANGTKLLVQTRRLTNERTVGKRSEDTGIILYEILVSGIDSDRGLRALSKMNWIHSQYGSKITNGDLVHTLALFVLEPPRWIQAYGWRPMSILEKVAIFVYWKEIGNRMGMVNIPATVEDLRDWTKAYEEEHMKYAYSNRKCYDATVDLFIKDVPSPLRKFALQLTSCFLEPYVRRSIGVEDPPVWVETFVAMFWTCRALFLKHECLPRFQPIDAGIREGGDGRLQRRDFIFEPWYVKESYWSKFLKKSGLKSKLLPGAEYKSQGYLPEGLGPEEYEARSKEPVLEQVRELRLYAEKGGAAQLGCPFALARPARNTCRLCKCSGA